MTKNKVRTRARKIQEFLAVLLFISIIVVSLFEYVNTRDKGYLIFPGIIAAALLWELITRYFGEDKKPKKR